MRPEQVEAALEALSVKVTALGRTLNGDGVDARKIAAVFWRVGLEMVGSLGPRDAIAEMRAAADAIDGHKQGREHQATLDAEHRQGIVATYGQAAIR
jgi:hypothetical protein